MATKMTRAKFELESIQQFYSPGTGESPAIVKLRAVTRSQPGSEDSSFWRYTPSGTIEMQIDNPSAIAMFAESGGAFYVDFTPVEEG